MLAYIIMSMTLYPLSTQSGVKLSWAGIYWRRALTIMNLVYHRTTCSLMYVFYTGFNSDGHILYRARIRERLPRQLPSFCLGTLKLIQSNFKHRATALEWVLLKCYLILSMFLTYSKQFQA